MSAITFAGVTAARKRLARLVEGLREAASGEVVARAAAKVGEQIQAIADRVTTTHQETGTAHGSVALAISGGRIDLSTIGYLRYHSWWPFRRGMPQAVVKRASLVFARELVAALGGDAPEEATEIVVEAEGAERAKADRAAAAIVRRQNKKLARWFQKATRKP